MNWDDVQQELNKLDEIDPKIMEYAGTAKDLYKLRHKLIKNAKKKVTDEQGLETLVEFIEIIGWSQKDAFDFVDSMDFKRARAKKLWWETQKVNPSKIEDLRQHVAYRLVRPYLEWLVNDLTKDYSLTYSALPNYALSRMKTNNPVLFEWALKKAYLEFYEIKHEDFKPDYKKSGEVSGEDLLAQMKQTASSD